MVLDAVSERAKFNKEKAEADKTFNIENNALNIIEKMLLSGGDKKGTENE